MKWFWRCIGLATLGVIVLFALSMILAVPRNDREWTALQKTLPQITWHGDSVTIDHVRMNRFRSRTDYDSHESSVTYNLNQIQKTWYVLAPFTGKEQYGLAHSFLTFDFADGKHLSVSIEARREETEKFSPWKGLLRSYELIYIIGDEEDVIGLRTNGYRDPTYLYPLTLTPAESKGVLQDMLTAAADLREHPQWYNSLTNMCTSRTAQHINAGKPGALPWWSYRIALPGFSDQLFYNRGLIVNDEPLESLKAKAYINDRAQAEDSRLFFSERIRQMLK